jgi:hypothetical protein
VADVVRRPLAYSRHRGSLTLTATASKREQHEQIHHEKQVRQEANRQKHHHPLYRAARHAASVQRTDYVTAGDFRTVATLWNTTAVGEFRCPAGAKIRVRYGVWPFEYNRQQQDLDCQTVKRLSVGSWSLARAKMQIKVPTSTYVTWTYVVEGP